MDWGGSRNRRAALLPTHRCKCHSPAFPPALFGAGLYRVCFAVWFYFSQASCGGSLSCEDTQILTQCFFQWCSMLPVPGSEDSFGHRCSLWSKGSLQCGSFVAALKAKAMWSLRDEWVFSGQPCSLHSRTGFVLLCDQTPLSFSSLSLQMSCQPGGMWSCCITCEHCWMLSLCAGCLPKGPNRKRRL